MNCLSSNFAAIAALFLLFVSAPQTSFAHGIEGGEQVVYRAGSVALSGTVRLPQGPGPFPAFVFQGGSGKSLRGSPWANAVADIFLANGVAVLQPDKRGSGQSGGDWRIASFEDLAGDLVAGVEYLKARPDILSDRIGVIGLSQGGRVAPIAAASSEDIAYVINMSGSAVSYVEQSFHEMVNLARQEGLGPDETARVTALNAAAGRFLISGDWDAYAAERNKGLSSAWSSIAAGFPDAPTAPEWEFLRLNYRYDPMVFWPLVRQPALVVYGADDEYDNVPVGESVRRLRFGFEIGQKPNYQIVVVPDTGHAAGMLSQGPPYDAARSALVAFIETYIVEE